LLKYSKLFANITKVFKQSAGNSITIHS